MDRRATVVVVAGLLLVSGLAVDPAGSVEQASKAERIEELMELTGASKLGVQMMHAMTDSLKAAMPNVPDDWWARFMAEVDPEDVTAIVVPIYDRHFTAEEIDAMLEFYRTPVGRSLIAKMPVVVQESMAAGQAWGKRLAEEILEELEAEGYEIPAQLRS